MRISDWSSDVCSSDLQAEDSTRGIAQAFGHSFTEGEDGYQAHGVVTHVIDRGGRWAANFHGLRFNSVNMVLYINGLINNAAEPPTTEEPGVLDWVKALFCMFATAATAEYAAAQTIPAND